MKQEQLKAVPVFAFISKALYTSASLIVVYSSYCTVKEWFDRNKGKTMNQKDTRALSLLAERFGHDTLISIATLDGNRPSVRIVNSYYEDGAFYTVTYALSNKMKQIEQNPTVAICGEWFTAHGIGENIGHPLDDKNTMLMKKLRQVFAEWYSNGHTNENDPNTCILRIRLTDGVLFHHGTKYELDFTENSTNLECML